MRGEVPPRPWERLIVDIAEAQHGTVSRAQLRERGLTRGVIDRMVARSLLHAVRRGVYAVGRRRLTARGRWMAAVLCGGDGTVLSHRSAGVLWGVTAAERTVEVTAPRGARARHRDLRCHEANLADDEITTLDGIPVTSLFRTVFDLASVLDKEGLERSFHEAEVAQHFEAVSLVELLRRHPGRRGTESLRELIDGGTPTALPRNRFEARFAHLVRSSNLPVPIFNAPLRLRDRFVEVDCMWPQEHLIVELDGRAVHGTRRSFERDRRRDRALTAGGWRVLRITWRQLRDEPSAIVDDLRTLLDASNRGGSSPRHA